MLRGCGVTEVASGYEMISIHSNYLGFWMVRDWLQLTNLWLNIRMLDGTLSNPELNYILEVKRGFSLFFYTSNKIRLFLLTIN